MLTIYVLLIEDGDPEGYPDAERLSASARLGCPLNAMKNTVCGRDRRSEAISTPS
jgi:hypothetical protein